MTYALFPSYLDTPQPSAKPLPDCLMLVGGVLTVVDAEQADPGVKVLDKQDERWAQWQRISEDVRLGGG